MQTFNAPIPLSLYIHLPWCVKKCPYCDFNSHEAKTDLPEEAYINQLLNELDHHLNLTSGRTLSSIFFGGGTPSLFSPEAIDTILQGVHQRFNLNDNAEITLEANPGTVDESRFKGFRKAGVNRLSLGIQSLHPERLKILGRIHGREEALRAIESAKNAGFDNFNLDLMHGLPNQSLEEALTDLNEALSFLPPHLSWYQLTLEPNTFFHRHPPTLPKEETLWDIQEKGHGLLSNKGFNHYEVSAYAQKDCQSQHNRNYWEFGDYIGIGAGAHSKITDFNQKLILRQNNVKHPKDYLNPSLDFTQSHHIVPEEELPFEFMLNALRLTQGVPSTLFEERTGLLLSTIEPLLKTAKTKGLLIDTTERLQPTELGQRFLNDLLNLFLINH